jgi:hypothetical protein
VADRVAQTVVASYLGERAEPRFHPGSYGYRPHKAALDAVATCRQRCWKFDWALDLRLAPGARRARSRVAAPVVVPPGAIILSVDQEEYVTAARAIRDANSPGAVMGVRSSVLNSWPIGGGKRIIQAVAELVRRTETELRALEPPQGDRVELEEHFLRPWSELAEYLESVLVAPGTRWLSANGALELLEDGPPERQEDIDFCIAYGLDDGPGQEDGPAGDAPPAHSGNGKA